MSALVSQFTKLLDLLEDLIDYRGWGYERFDGSVQGKERQAVGQENESNLDE